MEKEFILEYLENKPISLMEMKFYKCGIVRLSSQGQKVTVSERERRSLLKLKNGVNPIFREVI